MLSSSQPPGRDMPRVVCVLLSAALLQASSDGQASAAHPDSVSSILAQAQARLYDLQSAGLERLTFSLPVSAPEPAGTGSIELGSVRVSWEKGREPSYIATLADDLPKPMSEMSDLLTAQLLGQGRQVLG